MKKTTHSTTPLETLLRQNAPALDSPNASRVARVCARLAHHPPPRVPCRPHISSTSIIRIAACLVLAGSVTLLVRTIPRNTPAWNLPSLDPIPLFVQLNALVDTRAFTTALVTESDNLVSDLTALTATLNDRLLTILF